ncbi:hypothetical protein [Xanthomonas sp. WHRI 7945]|nr:hypothetical protein [Xanthomonas campestris pv. campestris]
MEQQFTREEFYDLIWSKPIKDLAPDFGISDVALGKICRQLGIAMPGRGYWAKLKAGTRLPPKPQLPPRGFGESDMVTVGQESWAVRKERPTILEELPPKPEFRESFTELAERAKTAVGNIALPKTLSKPHRVIESLLKSDDARRERLKDSPYSWERGDLFSSPFEKRRFRILNAIFNGVERANLRVHAKGQNPMDFSVAARNGSQVSFQLDHPSTKDRDTFIRPAMENRAASEKLRLEIKWYWEIPPGLQVIWEDKKDHQIEQDVSDIVASIVIAVEMSFRTWKIQQHELMIEERETRRQQEAAAQEAKIREERLRLERSRKAQLDKLFSDAAAYRLAKDLRGYIDEVLSANENDEHPVSDKDLQGWAAWAREQADSIDPVKSKAFLGKAPEPTEGRDETAPKTQPAQSTNPPQPTSGYRSEEWHPNKWYTKLHSR